MFCLVLHELHMPKLTIWATNKITNILNHIEYILRYTRYVAISKLPQL